MLDRTVRWIERYFIYFPERTLRGTPEHLGLTYEDVWFKAEDGTELHGWYIPGSSDVTWIFCHGNGGNISARLDNLRDIRTRLGAGVFIFDYRGYGLSEGVPSEAGTHLDALAALESVKRRLAGQRSRIVYFGRSMGCSVATRLAVEHPPDALILEGPPPSIPRIAHLHAPWIRFPLLRAIMRTRYETFRDITRVKSPLLVIHGDADDIVPMKFGKEVFDAANEPKEWLMVSGAGHDRADLVAPDVYYSAIETFIERHTRPGGENGATGG